MPTMTTRIYSTYLGGSGTDFGLDVAFDPLGGAVVAGSTNSTDLPVLAAIQPANGGAFDTFATKLRSNGVLEWSTYLGGASAEIGFDRMGVAVDPKGRPLITGITRSANHPLAVPVQPTYGGGDDAFASASASRPRSRVARGRSRRHAHAAGAGERFVHDATARAEGLRPPAGRRDDRGPDARAVPRWCCAAGFHDADRRGAAAAIAFPGSTVGARLLDPKTGAVRSESLCTSVPCN